MRAKNLVLFITALFVMSSLSYAASSIIAIDTCSGENLSSAKGVFNLECSASRLASSDALNITFDYKKQGPTVSYAGIRTVNNDSSVTNCSAISDVQVCYVWWTSNTHTNTCVISVDNTGNNGAWINFTKACPSTSKPSSITCVNVTSNETWACSNFFGASGTRARIQSEIGGHGPQESAFWDALFYNVTYSTDSAGAPLSDTPSNQTVEISSLSNITWTINASAAAGYYYVYRNGALFAGPSAWLNRTPLNISANNSAIGLWNYTLYFNDSAGTNGTPSSVFITVVNSSRVVSCAVLSYSNVVYVLQNNISAAINNCITIAADNVTLDGNGFTISNSGTADNGIYASNIKNVTVTNLTVTGFLSNGIYLDSVNNSFITGVNSSLNGDAGIYLYNATYSSIDSSETSGNSKGIKFESSKGNSVKGNKVHKNKYGIYFTKNASSNSIIENSLNGNGNNGSSIYLDASSNNVVQGGSINNSKSVAIYNTNLSKNNFIRIDIINTSLSEDIFLGADGLNGASFIDIKNIGLYNFSGEEKGSIVNFESTGNGSVIFNAPVKSSGDDLGADLQIKNNYVFVNSSKDKNWNVSANITLYNVPTNFTNPVILRNGELCPADVCFNFTGLNAGNVSFSVAGWSSYSIGEMPDSNSSSGNTSANNAISSAAVNYEIPGGYASKTYLIDRSDFESGYSNNMFAADKYRFVFNNKNYTLTMKSFNSSAAKITINANALGLLAKGQAIKFDADIDGTEDVLLRYDGIKSGKAVMFIQEAKKTYQSPEKNEISANNTSAPNSGESGSGRIPWVPADMIVVAALIAVLFLLKNHHEKRHRWFTRKSK